MNCSAGRPCFIDHLFLTFVFCQVPRRNFLQLTHSLSTDAFAAGIFKAWCLGTNLWTKLWCCSELFPFPATKSSWWFGNDSYSLADFLASRMHANLVLILLDAPLPQFFCFFAKHCRSHWCFQLLTRILDGFFEFLILRVNEIHPSQFSCVIQMELFIWSFLLLLQLGISFPFSSKILAINDLAWMHAVFSFFSTRTTFEGFPSKKMNWVKPVH